MADSGDEQARTAPTNTDVVIVGAGHNGLVAAAYLARYGTKVTVLERLDHIGGAAVSERPFPGVDANLSRYSYLVSLLPYAIVRDLELDIELRSRPVASYTPVLRSGKPDGLLVERRPGPRTAESFRRLTGSDREWRAWKEFYGRIERAARDAGSFLAGAGAVVLFALIVLSPLIVLAVAWIFGSRAYRRREERRLLSAA